MALWFERQSSLYVNSQVATCDFLGCVLQNLPIPLCIYLSVLNCASLSRRQEYYKSDVRYCTFSRPGLIRTPGTCLNLHPRTEVEPVSSPQAPLFQIPNSKFRLQHLCRGPTLSFWETSWVTRMLSTFHPCLSITRGHICKASPMHLLHLHPPSVLGAACSGDSPWYTDGLKRAQLLDFPFFHTPFHSILSLEIWDGWWGTVLL